MSGNQYPPLDELVEVEDEDDDGQDQGHHGNEEYPHEEEANLRGGISSGFTIGDGQQQQRYEDQQELRRPAGISANC